VPIGSIRSLGSTVEIVRLGAAPGISFLEPHVSASPVELTTQLLNRLAGGDRSVEDDILPVVYRELHELARASVTGPKQDATLQPTALVHEAWLRLVDQDALHFDGRRQFFRLASRIMRSVLVDHFRAKQARKREATPESRRILVTDRADQPEPLDVLALEEALEKLETFDPELCRVVEMRFFAGLPHPEISRITGLPLRTVERRWRQARAWLRTELQGAPE
jgi:RNA polymerase sigma factor (TIGR02999 family)